MLCSKHFHGNFDIFALGFALLMCWALYYSFCQVTIEQGEEHHLLASETHHGRDSTLLMTNER